MDKNPNPLPLSPVPYLMVFLSVMGVMLLSSTFVLWKIREQTEANIHAELRNITQIVDNHLDEMMRRIHANLRQIAQETPLEALDPKNRAQYDSAMRTTLINLAVFFPEINSYRIYDAGGKCLYVSGPKCPTRTIEDREYFIEAKANPAQELHFSPVIVSRVSNTPVVSVAKAIFSGEGRFMGVVNVGIDMHDLAQKLAKLNMGSQGIIALRSAQNLALITHTPEVPDEINQPLPKDNPLWLWLASQQKEIATHFVGQMDGVERLYVTRRLENYPFVVLAGRSPENYLSEWRSMVWLAFGVELPFLVGLALFLRRVWRERLAEHQWTIKLAAARDAAEAANRAKSAFLTNMGHELRTPLHGVLGMVELAKRRMIDPKGLDMLGKAKFSAERLLVLINEILDLSSMESDRLVLAETPFQLSECVAHLVHLLGAKASDKGLSLSVDLAPSLTAVGFVGDGMRLGQVLHHLVGNAIKFTPQGRVEVRIHPVGECAGGLRVAFEIHDTGVGITPEALARLFGVFEQADNSMTRQFGGSGMGLAIAKRLVNLMQGEIKVESTPGVGSTFSFTLPLRFPALEADAPRAPVEHLTKG